MSTYADADRTANECSKALAARCVSLGPYASPGQVYQAMCTDDEDVYGTSPLTISAERLAAAYYGWQFASDNPVSDFELEGCSP